MGPLAGMAKGERWSYGWRCIAKGWEGRRIDRLWAYIQQRRARGDTAGIVRVNRDGSITLPKPCFDIPAHAPPAFRRAMGAAE